nr:GRIP1-associated protein 1-like isoform X2 [Ciona intestinalis]XP_018669335.1 GRIP1-associated protein 1-like isoform X1 [Ciona intestinalis]|eukprot:XP_009859967.1 GRIP1-associated protein 1-like isoform X2 [Ciona intestinalis]
MAQSLSEEEFHRMQIQILEMRTENYKLKDENKKQAMRLKDLTDKETRLDKELNKQIKLKKALSTLNKSKQAQEYEALLQTTEQEFALQNQTLMQELARLSAHVEKLEKDNKSLNTDGHGSDAATDSELRRVQAQNTALKRTVENMQIKHREELQQTIDSFSAKQASQNHHMKNGEQTDSHEADHGTHDHHEVEDNVSMENVTAEVDGNEMTIESPVEDETSIATSITSSPSNITDERLLHSEAQCQRLQQKLNELQDIEVQLATEREEKLLLQNDLDYEVARHTREQRAFTEEVESLREKFERKQTAFVNLQEEMEQLRTLHQEKLGETTQQHESEKQTLQQEKEKLTSEVTSLGKALQNSHNMLDGMQASMQSLQAKVKLHEEEMRREMEEKRKLEEQLGNLQQHLNNDEQKKSESSSQIKSLETEVLSLRSGLERSKMERDDAVTKFEENVRASASLLERVNQVEKESEDLRHELKLANELAEKRKKVMDQQAVESQENNAKFTERINALLLEHETSSAKSIENYESKVKILEETCKRQEQELIRMNHQDRVKTRELDTLQQQIRDQQSTLSSLENSSGWFERALKDAEKMAAEKEEDHLQQLEDAKSEHEKEMEKLRVQFSSKEKEVEEAERQVALAMNETTTRDATIERMKQDVLDEVSKQKLIEKKGHQALKDLKKQLVMEKKRSEKLQEKMKEISSSNSNLDELLQVVDLNDKTTTGDGSSVSSFSFRDFISNKQNPDTSSQAGTSNLSSTPVATATVSKAESRDLLSRLTSVQQEKWNLEEKVRHLEESAGAMADELVEKTKLLQQYVHHTRADVHKMRSSNEELASRTFGNRVRSIITGQEEADVTNIRELNRKLTRMLEEEMTKNMALKQDLANLSEQLSSK